MVMEQVTGRGRRSTDNEKERKLYTCEICNTDYADKEKAKQCAKKDINY